jgi:LPXTG-site transpeptidase (sortase) family protein
LRKKIEFFLRLVLCEVILFSAHSVWVVRAQNLSFPAEINKSFTPISIPSGGISRLRVTIYNPNSFQLNNASWTDNLVEVQPGLSIANPVNISNTCGGSVVAVPGTTILSLSGGIVPEQAGSTPGECTVSVDVTSTMVGNLINTIPANALSSTGELSTGELVSITNTTPASATLTIIGVNSPSINKSFSPSTTWVGETSVLTITINNNNPVDALTQASLTDALPENVVIADPPSPANALQNCGTSASLVANPGGTSIMLSNATIAPSPNCIIRVNVISSTPGEYVNTIPANALTTQQGLTNSSPASARLNVQGVGVEKSFSPPSFQAGTITTLTITLQNPTGAAYTGVSISDTLPGTVLTVVPNSGTTTCGGTVSTSLPRTVTLSGGTIPAGSVNDPGTCTITVQVTAPSDAITATFNNTIPANSLVITQGVSNLFPVSARVQVYAAGAGILGGKSFSPGTIDAGGSSRLRINFTAPADTALTNFTFTDTLPTGVVISNAEPATVSAGCGETASLQADTGTNAITLTNATINPGALCRVQVWVTSGTPGTVTNSIPPANVTNDQNQAPANPLTANLVVQVASDLSMSKGFSPSTVPANGISTLTITLQNTSSSLLVDVTLTDDLPGNNTDSAVRVAPIPNASTTCGSGVVTATPGSQLIRMTGGTIPAQAGGVPGICTISVDVQGSRSAGNRNNTIPAANVTGTMEGTDTTVNPSRDASARLVVQDLAIGVVKGFDPLTVFGGSASTMSIQLNNPTNVQLTDIGFTDNMPAGMFLANPISSSVGTCGGALSGNPGDSSFSFSGGSLAASATCVMTLSVTTNVNGNLTNTITAGAITTANGVTNSDPAEATLTNLAGASLSKYFSPNPMAAGNYSQLTITIQNTGNIPLSGVGFRDTLLAGVTLAGPPGPSPINNCGGILTAESGTQDILLSGGALSASSSCTIAISVTSNTPGAYQNTIPIGALSNDQNTTNIQAASDTLTVVPIASGGGNDDGGGIGGGGEGGGPGRGTGGNRGGSAPPVGLFGLIPVTGFAPGRVTNLSGLPVTRYEAFSDVTLEVPVLKLKMPVVGVPMENETWDVNWLLNQAGWLEGSAFPGFSGNSVLTSHVTLPYGQPGPFANLHKLKTGDKIFVHSYGELYIFEVRSVEILEATDPSILRHEEEPWLTLVTCADYSDEMQTYLKRLVVKAVFIQTQADNRWTKRP